MKRREFITLIGGAAAWPLATRSVRAQHDDRMRRIPPSIPTGLVPARRARLGGCPLDY
jgi:hypothetical protein